MLDFAFHVLQLRNVLLETLEWNAAGLAAYERAGFRRIGVRRGARISRGQPTDIVSWTPSRRISARRYCAEQARGRPTTDISGQGSRYAMVSERDE